MKICGLQRAYKDDSKIFHTKLTMVEDMCTHVVSLRDYVCFDQQISDATPTFSYCDMNVPNQGRDQPLIVCRYQNMGF